MATPKKKNYLNNGDLLIEVAASKSTTTDNNPEGVMTDKLARMLMLLTERFARRGNYIGYTFNDDMQAYAMMQFVKTWYKFDETKYSNAFAYYTTCVYNSFNQYLNKERKQRDIRDEVLLKNGLMPSFNYVETHKNDPVGTKDESVEVLDSDSDILS